MNSVLSVQEWHDLRWLVEGPDLMALTPPLPFLSVSLPRPEEPIEDIAERLPPQHRVGRYVESLVSTWLENTPGISALQKGILIREGNRTVGELDFVFRYQDQLRHLEIALKFYLHCPVEGHLSSPTLSHFPGPNASDNFEKKRDRLLRHQLPLGRTAFPAIETSHALVKGVIFYRPGETTPTVLPETMNPAHRRGIWIRANEIDRLLEESWARDCRGDILEKPFWLSGWSPEFHTRTMEELHAGLHSHFAAKELSDRPVLLSLRPEGNAGENLRLFVVPGEWPRHCD